MKCHNVTSCDKLTRNDRAARTLFAGMDKLAGGQTLQILFAQASNNCASWYDSLQARLSSHNAQCSGTLSQSEVDSCNAAAAQLNAEVSQYNANCN